MAENFLTSPGLEQERFGLAADFLLGGLDARQRTVVMEMRAGDPGFDTLVSELEKEFAPLLFDVAAVEPPPALRARVLGHIFEQASLTNGGPAIAGNEPQAWRFRRTIWRWRMISAVLLALTLALSAVLAVMMYQSGSARRESYVATLMPLEQVPGFVAVLDLAHDVLKVKRIGVGAPQTKAYELWAVGGGRPAPSSLGLIQSELAVPMRKLGGSDYLTLSDTRLAVSLEPPGGSPTGLPSGPVVFVGQLFPTGE